MAVQTAPTHKPVDPTQTKAWEALQARYQELTQKGIDLRTWFAQDPTRTSRLTFTLDEFQIDLSKNLVDEKTLQLLCELAREVGLEERRADMYSGKHVNTTEDRAVLHTALRRPADQIGTFVVDGQDTVADVRYTLERMYAFCDRVRSSSSSVTALTSPERTCALSAAG